MRNRSIGIGGNDDRTEANRDCQQMNR